MSTPAAFLSYVRTDDEHDGGAISRIRAQLAEEVRMQTGEEFLIFQDREDILWGVRWRDRIERSIDTTIVLIAVITPSYLRSAACREEVERFLQREKQLGRNDLILPLYYVDTPALQDSQDNVARELASRQYVDWRPLRFEPLDGAALPVLVLLDMEARLVAGNWQWPLENRIRVGPLLVVLALEPLDDGAAAMQRQPADRRRALLRFLALRHGRMPFGEVVELADHIPHRARRDGQRG